MTAADHTPSPATDGLREAIEALADEFHAEARRRCADEADVYETTTLDRVARRLRAILAAHPAPPSETAPVLDGPSFGDYWPPNETTRQPRRDEAISVMAYLDGWLSGEWPEVARYLRDHAPAIADHMVDDGCADDTPPSETATEDRQGLANVERRIKAMASCAQPADGDGDHDGCFVAECLAFVREEREAQQARDFIGLASSDEETQP